MRIVGLLYLEHHGIVAMSSCDPKRKQRYAFNDPATRRSHLVRRISALVTG
ncbi:MAG: hypothetical protein WB919_22220 [Candidatus Sulfotelmatobacter sp.]